MRRARYMCAVFEPLGSEVYSGRPVLRNVNFVSRLKCLILFLTLIQLYCIGFRVGTTVELCFLTLFHYCSCRSEPVFLDSSMMFLNPFTTAIPYVGTKHSNFK